MECFEYLVNPHMKSMELIEVFSPTKFHRVQLTDSLTWYRSTTMMIKLANQQLYYLRKLKQASVLIKMDTVESVLYKHLVLQMQPLKQEASAEDMMVFPFSLYKNCSRPEKSQKSIN